MSKPSTPSRLTDILKATEPLQAVRQTGALADAMKAIERLRPQIEAATRLSRQLEAQRAPIETINKMVRQAEALQGPMTALAIPAAPSPLAFASGAPEPLAHTPVVRRRVSSTADLGRLVRERRLEMGLTQQDLADAACTGRRFISELETGKATLEFGKIIQACSVLGIDLFAMTR